ncbi:hypothetical protein BKA69DRAFT_767784 [Paraphysoderma sedebokerense]|nr:hypothetical protein BKA69DRAFT_767784 [Paraphysoderma sedebokerense]
MVQYHVIKCFSGDCGVFQVQQVKTTTNKWTCKICQQKQSLQNVFYESSSAAECRKVCQDLNMKRGEMESMKEEMKLAQALSVPSKRNDSKEMKKNKVDESRGASKTTRQRWVDYVDEEEITESVDEDNTFGFARITSNTDQAETEVSERSRPKPSGISGIRSNHDHVPKKNIKVGVRPMKPFGVKNQLSSRGAPYRKSHHAKNSNGNSNTDTHWPDATESYNCKTELTTHQKQQSDQRSEPFGYETNSISKHVKQSSKWAVFMDEQDDADGW